MPFKDTKQFPLGFASVAVVARYLDVSEQRVRHLLKGRRLMGYRGRVRGSSRIVWVVQFPTLVRGGQRGPRLGMKARLRKKDNSMTLGRKEARNTVPHGLKLV